MTLSLFQLLKAGPPPPKVVLLPDAMFFTRAVPIAADSTPADVTAQAELALETLSPFPPSQLYHGFFWPPGAERALVFAAYRRRFTSEQVAGWDTAELVLPVFASLLGGDMKPPATLVVPSSDGWTAIYWDAGPVPAKVVFRPVGAEATEAERALVRDELLGVAPTNRHIVLAASPEAESARSEREFAFRAEAFVSRLPTTQAAALDVRDKADLAALRRARRRDIGLWRGFLGLAAALVLLGIGELTLVGVGLWQKSLVKKADAQRPVVEKIETAQSLTTRINELSTKRLLPFEMMAILRERKNDEVMWFQRTTTDGLYSLSVEAISTSPAAVSAYQAALVALPAIEKVEIRDQRTRDNLMTFTLVASFRPDALKPTPSNP